MSERETAAKALIEYVVANGPLHEDECPCDDTCRCVFNPVNAGVNLACRLLASLPPAAAPQQDDVEKWRMAALLKDRTRREIRNRVLMHGESAESVSEDYGIPAQFARHLAAFQLAPDVPDASAARQFWLTKHGGLGHAITTGDEFDRCSCGSEFWPAAALPPAAPQTCEWRWDHASEVWLSSCPTVNQDCGDAKHDTPTMGWKCCPYCTLPLVLTPAEEPK